MCFNINKRRLDTQTDVARRTRSKTRRLSNLALAASQVARADSGERGSLGTRSPLSPRKLNVEVGFINIKQENDEKPSLSRKSSVSEKGSLIDLTSSSPPPGVHDCNQTAHDIDHADSSFSGHALHNYDDTYVFPCLNNADEAGDLVHVESREMILPTIPDIPGPSEQVFQDSEIFGLLRDSDAHAINFTQGPSISAAIMPYRLDGSYNDGHQLDFLDLPPLPSSESIDGDIHSDEDRSQRARSTIYGRRRPPRSLHGKFWEAYDFLCNQFEPPTELKPFPILSKSYVSPIRISNPLSTRGSASTKSVEFADSAWRPLINRYGYPNPLQNEERRVFDHIIYTLSHLPYAICRGDIGKKEDITQFLRFSCNYLERLSREERRVRRQAQKMSGVN